MKPFSSLEYFVQCLIWTILNKHEDVVLVFKVRLKPYNVLVVDLPMYCDLVEQFLFLSRTLQIPFGNRFCSIIKTR